MVENDLILPLQLFDPKELRKKNIELVYIVEEPYYFTRQKLAYQRSCIGKIAGTLLPYLREISLKKGGSVLTIRLMVDFVGTLSKRRKNQVCGRNTQNTIKSATIHIVHQIEGLGASYSIMILQISKCKKLKKMPNAQIEETLNYWLSREEMRLFGRKTRYHFKSVYEY